MNVLAPQPSVRRRQAGTAWAAHTLTMCGVSEDSLIQVGFSGQGEADAD